LAEAWLGVSRLASAIARRTVTGAVASRSMAVLPVPGGPLTASGASRFAGRLGDLVRRELVVECQRAFGAGDPSAGRKRA
jgi:hypothetical protein